MPFGKYNRKKKVGRLAKKRKASTNFKAKVGGKMRMKKLKNRGRR